MTHKLSVINLFKKYGEKSILEDISFDVEPGEFISILGSSGCGKTTLLRILMGIETSDRGKILKDGIDITSFPPSKRGMGMVFQNYALFPNMNVYDNIAFALRANHVKKSEIEKRVNAAISITGLSDHVYKKPNYLSGGQQQRVAIARTIVLNPDIILFDEPMAALDADIRMSLRKELKKLQKTLGITMIYVTHDQEEAFSMSDRVLVMNDCVISQFGTPKDIYDHPANEFVKQFVIDHLNEKVELIEKQIH